MKQVLIKKGKAYIDNIPAPTVNNNTVLVKVSYSCISVGTEMTNVISSGESLINKAIKQPEKIAKVIKNIKTEGLIKTVQKVQGKLDEGKPTGYSISGVVTKVGNSIKDIKIGDKVACAGAGIANHAEYVEIPRNLLVKIPDALDLNLASTVTLGAIALQGVRRANPKLGEYVAVIGLGILGQLTVQMLKANGCKVIGIDLNDSRIEKALSLGMDKGINPKNDDIVQIATSYSNGYGVDSVIITAATNSKEPLSQAFQMCRRKGKVILVGVVGMEINRNDMYQKELDFIISTSYGPGRYDNQYEQKGIDYPYSYVRWTENRNMEEYLSLLKNKKLNINSLIEKEFNVDDASVAYEQLRTSEKAPLMVLLKYPTSDNTEKIIRNTPVNTTPIKKEGLINVALIGAGGFAKAMHLPNLLKLKEYYNIYSIVSRTGSNAKLTAQQFNANFATTDFNDVLNDNNVDAVIITTRHDLHAKMAMQALRAGKAVFLEKPMALNEEELNELVAVIKETQKPFMVGFNRRFSKYAQEVKKHIANRTNPMIINYQMNAGYIPLDHWVHSKEGGGRIVGEACHIFDLFNFFADAEVETISAERITPKTKHYSSEDNLVTTLKYSDGSVCTLTYTAMGNNKHTKEFCQIYVDGKIIIIDDYKKLTGYGVNIKNITSSISDKGQFEELIAFANYINGKMVEEISLLQTFNTSKLSLKINGL